MIYLSVCSVISTFSVDVSAFSKCTITNNKNLKVGSDGLFLTTAEEMETPSTDLPPGFVFSIYELGQEI